MEGAQGKRGPRPREGKSFTTGYTAELVPEPGQAPKTPGPHPAASHRLPPPSSLPFPAVDLGATTGPVQTFYAQYFLNEYMLEFQLRKVKTEVLAWAVRVGCWELAPRTHPQSCRGPRKATGIG